MLAYSVFLHNGLDFAKYEHGRAAQLQTTKFQCRLDIDEIKLTKKNEDFLYLDKSKFKIIVYNLNKLYNY